MTDHSRSGAGPLVLAIGLLLLPLLYVGSYLSLVQPTGRRIYDRSGMRVASYRIDNPMPGKIYWPLERIDRKVRPKDWSQQKIYYML
jgi:hypothetical protein